MASIMIDLETADITPSAVILTVGAQMFDPLGEGILEGENAQYYARVDTDSQPNRTIDDGTLAWWATQPQESQDEAFGLENRVPLKEVLERLYKMIWASKHVWTNGAFDMTILENAYKQVGMALPWKYHVVRDTRTVYSLWPDLPKPEAAHHALDDCWRQIALLQATLQHLGIKEIT